MVAQETRAEERYYLQITDLRQIGSLIKICAMGSALHIEVTLQSVLRIEQSPFGGERLGLRLK